MGSFAVGGTFVHSDWRLGIEEIRNRIEMDPDCSNNYNTVCYVYGGDKSGVSKKEVDKYVEDRMDNKLFKRDGEVIKIGCKGYRLIKTTFKEDSFYVALHYNWLLKGTPYTAVLAEESNIPGQMRKISGGSFEAMKREANKFLRNSNFAKPLYIITKKKVYTCWGDYREVKTTTRQTDEKTFVQPMYEFRYYGWAAE